MIIEKVLCKNDYGNNSCVSYCGGECVSSEKCPYQESINSDVVYGKYNYNTVADKLTWKLINYFENHACEIENYVSIRDFICDHIEEIKEEFKREYKDED